MGGLSCFIIGEDTLTSQCGEILLRQGHDLRGVISGQVDVERWADERGIPLIDPGADLVATLGERPFDYLLSIANLRMLPNDVVSLARLGTINFHDGPLPRYAGVHCTSWALMNHELQHGVTWHLISELVDGGLILKQRLLDISEDETAFSLNTKCFEAGIETFGELIGELADGTNEPSEQDLSVRSYFGMWQRPEAAGVISWTSSARETRALVRALDFGPSHPNVLGTAKVVLGDDVLVCRKAELAGTSSSVTPGTVLALGPNGCTVATGDGDIEIAELIGPSGETLSIEELLEQYDLHVGMLLPQLDDTHRELITTLNNETSRRETFWLDRLSSLRPVSLPYLETTNEAEAPAVEYPIDLSADIEEAVKTLWPDKPLQEAVAAAFSLYLGRVGGQDDFDLGLRSDDGALASSGTNGIFARQVPWRCAVDSSASAREEMERSLEELDRTRSKKTHLADMWTRLPKLREIAARVGIPRYAVAIDLCSIEGPEAEPGTDVSLRVTPDGRSRLACRSSSVDPDDAQRMTAQFATFMSALCQMPDKTVSELPLLTDAEAHRILVEWNDTGADYPTDATVSQLFVQQVRQTPDALAIAFGDVELTYSELNGRANKVARRLIDLGVGRDVVVAVSVDRSIEMTVVLLGILKAGGAYLPLDPTYPKERIAFILDDAGASVLMTQEALLDALPPHTGDIVLIDRDWPEIARLNDADVNLEIASEDLAYVIYTSGSTGKPKGVMVEHGNAVSFFSGMDERIPHKPGDVWLAVTSLSFDISVLELFWTLCRGFKVVIYTDDDSQGIDGSPTPGSAKAIDYSLFFFSADQGENPTAKYRLPIEAAKFGDVNGFVALWTPERHFHDFGGLYPNPSVTGAALAMITENAQIRSGSVVAPLHSPIRIAEEWSVVDNLSGGRVGLAFASGWMPEDFVIRGENFDDKKEATFGHMETVRSLWRGDAVDFPGPGGANVSVRTLPRPIQAELPVWITTAGNPETYAAAAKAGAFVLTHLLGQSVEEVGEKVAAYREAWRTAGHPGDGHVSLMIHTFVGSSQDQAREAVREPLKEYLRTAANLLRTYSSAFPTFRNQGLSSDQVNFGDLPAEDLDAVLDFAFNRYFETSGLFGTPETCVEMVDKIKANDIDEIACLVDFGIPTEVVLDNLPHLNTLRAATSGQERTGKAEAAGISDLIDRHEVTHFQCTPSMARMLLTDDEIRTALGKLEVMMVGGEACSVSLAGELMNTINGRIINMYGPTETTIWSGTHEILGEDGPVPIGRPILNTQFFVVNSAMQPQPVGVPGELLIGGPGVTRGYLNRASLTADRFIPNPFPTEAAPRLYRTGDLVRYTPDGLLEFIGRADHQVKIRGHRIELGEVETSLNRHALVREAVVMAREDIPGDLRLVAYTTMHSGADVSANDLRHHVRELLPEYMVPSRVLQLEEFPQTPNKKVDRKALPPPGEDTPQTSQEFERPDGAIESKLAAIWSETLGIRDIGRTDDFFELGGDSLSLVHVTSRVADVFGQKVSIGAFVQKPTIAHVATLLEEAEINADQDVGLEGGPSGASEAITTRRMQPWDLDAVVDMHLHHFPDWRVTKLGRPFLEKMYRWFMSTHGELAIVATRDDEVIGFTVGTVGPYKKRLLRYATAEAIRGFATHPLLLTRHSVDRSRERAKNGPPPIELDPRMSDPTLANNRIMAMAKSAGGAGLELLVAFEEAASELGTEPFFHEDPTNH